MFAVVPRVRTATAVLAALVCAACQGHEATGPARAARTPAHQTTTAGPAGPATAPPRPARSPRPVHPHYVFPVRGCAASPSASHHDYPASDIFTGRGCRFVAVTAGRVDEVSFTD